MQRRIVEACAKLCDLLTVACSQELDLCGGPTSSHLEALILLGRLASSRPASTISSIVIRALATTSSTPLEFALIYTMLATAGGVLHD